MFKQGNEILFRVEENVEANLEKISVKFKEKEKILEEIKKQKLDLVKTLDIPNMMIDMKEGFLLVKTKDTYFKKRYFKIFKGDLIYYKIKKGTDQLEQTKTFTLCNLLLSNVKKNEKEYEYSFCFEIISAVNKKSFILQAETERDAEEWLSAIRNAIANSISNYNHTSVKKNKSVSPNKDNSPTNTKKSQAMSLDGSYHSFDSNIRRQQSKNSFELQKLIEKLTNHSKCMDCDSDNPVW